MDFTVDLGGIRLGSASSAASVVVDGIDQYVDRRPYLRRQLLSRNSRRKRHDSFEALLLDVLWNLLVHRRRRGTFDGFELEGANAVELRLLEPGEKIGDVLFGLAREADDKRGAYGEVRDLLAPS